MVKRIVIIGGGPGGYVAAIRAAQLGAQVILVEKDELGGTCLNRGCIPTKTLIESANMLRDIKKATTLGIVTGKTSVDFAAVNRRKEALIKRLVGGISSLMRKNKIEVIKDTATVTGPGAVKLENGDKITADSIILATGSKPQIPSIPGIVQPGVITSQEALSLEQAPQSIVVIGGGVIGLELGQIMCRMGSEVTVLEMMSQILPNEDTEMANLLEKMLKEDGIEIVTGATVKGIRAVDGGKLAVSYSDKAGKQMEAVAAKVLVAVGRNPCTDGLEAEQVGLSTDKGAIRVNERMETNIPGIYAVGDVTGRFMLAHTAMEGGKCAAENIMGIPSQMDYRAIPRCVYTSPELASVGLSEAAAREAYSSIKVGKFPFSANSRALIHDETRGMVKFITDAEYGQVLGVSILGPQATELIAEATLGIRLEATVEDMAAAIHAHPTLSEAVQEAALNADGKALHI
ncbi:MAG: dihydrolipoyl dehydrogenase [Chloroflexota bacterium]